MDKIKTTLSTAIILLFASNSIAQSEEIQIVNTSEISPIPVKSVKLAETKERQPIVSETTSEPKEDIVYPITVSYSREQKNQSSAPRTLKDIDTDIANIKAKMDYVRNSPEMDVKARAEGWYDRNETLLQNLEEEKSNLLKK